MPTALLRRGAAPALAAGSARAPWWPALVPAAVLAALGGLLVAQRQSLWYDELYTARVGTAGLGALARAVLDGTGTTPYLATVPPSYNAPYYVAVHLWLAVTGLPADDVGLRLLSLVPAVAAVAVLVRVVQRLAGTAPALAAGLLVATNPLVLEYSAEARMYGLALLATSVAALGLARALDDAPHGALLLGVGVALAGLAHWFTLPVSAGLVVAGLVLRRRRGLPLAVAGAVGALPAVALMGLLFANGTGTSAVGLIRESATPVPVAALLAWTSRDVLLVAAYVAALASAAVVARRRPELRRLVVVGACWLVVPLVLLQAADLVRPVFVPRYLLPALLGSAVLAAAGTALGRRQAPLVAGLVVLSLVAGLPLVDRLPRDDARGAVQALERQWSPGEPVVAVDRRAALALDHYASPALRADLRLPPDDAPAADGTVWLLRHLRDGRVQPSDDDAQLAAAGLRVVGTQVFDGSSGDLSLQRWGR